jgi:hypothetical protein
VLSGRVCHPKKKENQAVGRSRAKLLEQGPERARVVHRGLPEIADEELGRKLIHLIRTQQAEAKSPKSLDRWDRLAEMLDYLPLSTETLRKAAELWAEARIGGFSNSPRAVARWRRHPGRSSAQVTGTLVTTNRRHLSRFVPAPEGTETEAPP